MSNTQKSTATELKVSELDAVVGGVANITQSGHYNKVAGNIFYGDANISQYGGFNSVSGNVFY